MASSDNEAETVLQTVSNHHFVDNDGAPISFAVLPIMLDDAKKVEAPRKQVSVRGTTDGGLLAVFKEVVAWKLRLDGKGPEIFVLCKDNNWIKLEKPKKSYKECIRTTLMTIHLLHFLKKNPEASMKSFCEYLRLALSSSDDKICKDDFRDHIQLVKLFLKRDKTLAKSQILRTFVKNPDNAFVEDFHDGVEERPFIVDDKLDGIGMDEGNDFEDESDGFDYVCAICDNGGELLCCEGRCMRSFHATRGAGQDSNCASLGLTRTEVEAMQNFMCKNCQLKQHQCFACGKLGSSDKSAKAEVFSCISANCGHFYHPNCVAELLFPENKTKATELEKNIAAGESFACPEHICTVCKQVENKEVEELQFAVCRRCPKAYHRKCLPRKIGFKDIEEENVIQRAWEGLLPNNRILTYCLKHDIDIELGTPSRNHITFPEFPERKREADGQRTKTKKNKQVSDGMNRDLNIVKPAQRTEKLSTKDGSHTLLIGPKTIAQIIKDSSQHKIKTPMKDAKSALKKVYLKEFVKFRSTKIDKPTIDIEKAVLDKAKVADSMLSLDAKLINSTPKILPDIRKDVLDLGEEEPSSTQDGIRKTHSTPCTHACSARHIDKTTTLPNVQGAIEGVHTVLEKLEGCCVEYAKAVCESEILKQVADKLQWYVQDGDMVVDFSHGTKEFSLLMKAKLDAAGKNCSLKNYDILQSKNGFNFEMRDWMTVQPKELLTGTKLIMVLNPLFGANVHLANQLIDKALTFKSKLLVLIVPEETQRLDKKNSQYNLIWEDSECMLWKQMEQWNVRPPVLYFCSRSDWTAVHRGIALSQGHISRMQPALLINKKAQEGGEDAPLVDKNTEERYKEKDVTQGESMSSTKQGIAVQAQVQVEGRNDAPQVEKHLIEMYEGINAATEPLETRRKVNNNKNYIQETPKKRETFPPQKESRKEVDNRKQHSEERPKRKKDVVRGEKVTRREAYIQKFEQSNKQESAEIHKDKPPVTKKIKQQQETFLRIDTHDPRDMSISRPDKRVPVDLYTGQGPALGVSQTPLDKEILYGGYPTSRPEMRMTSSVGRSVRSHDEVDDISRRYATAQSCHRAAAHCGDYSVERLRGYNNKDAYNHNRVIDVRGRHSEVDSRAHCMQAKEITNGNEINSDADFRTQHRTCTLKHEVVENVYGRPLDSYTRTHLCPYHGMHDGEDHPQRSRFSLRGSQSTSGHSPTSTYRFTNPAAKTSASQQYAPRLDEMNYLRPHHWSPGIPLPERDVYHDMHSTRGGIPLDASIFALEAYPPFPNQGSCGWISD